MVNGECFLLKFSIFFKKRCSLIVVLSDTYTKKTKHTVWFLVFDPKTKNKTNNQFFLLVLKPKTKAKIQNFWLSFIQK